MNEHLPEPVVSTALTDEELALLVQKGDSEKFGLLMERYEKKLFRYGRTFLQDKDNVADVVQEVFIKTYQSIQSFDIQQRFSPWIYRIAHNMLVNAIKKRSRSPLSFIDFDTLISHPIYEDPRPQEEEQKHIKAMIDKGLEMLSQKYREVLILYYIEELSYKEISDILRIPTGTVGIRLARARESLKKKIPKHHDY
jgi:RNA polymerase sigma-70 factor (ECF subfamily)